MINHFVAFSRRSQVISQFEQENGMHMHAREPCSSSSISTCSAADDQDERTNHSTARVSRVHICISFEMLSGCDLASVKINSGGVCVSAAVRSWQWCIWRLCVHLPTLQITGAQSGWTHSHGGYSQQNNTLMKLNKEGLSMWWLTFLTFSQPDLLNFKKGWMTRLGEDGQVNGMYEDIGEVYLRFKMVWCDVIFFFLPYISVEEALVCSYKPEFKILQGFSCWRGILHKMQKRASPDLLVSTRA